MLRFISLVAVLSIAMAALPAKEGRGRGRGRGGDSPAAEKPGKDKERRAEFSREYRAADRTAILNFYHSRPGGLPPGLARRDGHLPPGLERQIRRNGALPPGLEKRFVPFPPELEHRLPPCPAGVRRGFIGGVAVMWSPRTGIVLDAVAMFGR
ncbi:MAG: hypothetical protein LAQ30_23065 [Acidobacteriia bacterium]|nr:hypothetical protein [Terriglobia bacterium]